MARILLAASKPVLFQLNYALKGHELIQATHSQEAERLILEDGIELFVIGVHFDDSRAMELVKLIRNDKKHKKTPIIVVRLTSSEIVGLLQQTMDTMTTLGVIEAYLELEKDALAEVKLRDAVAAQLQKATGKENSIS